jgi:antitoxin (DNA-binding transcriptional repressor) of toxin-antitoxin stability system
MSNAASVGPDDQGPQRAAGAGAPATQVMVGELRARLAHYLQLVATGESVAIVSRGQVVAELRPPARPAARPNTRGSMRGQIWMAPGWEDTPEDLIDLMEGGEG